MGVSAIRIQDKDSGKRLSVVRSTTDPTKFGLVLVNPDGSKVGSNFIKGPNSNVVDENLVVWDGTSGRKAKDGGKVPKNTSDLNNDSGFITNAVNDLVNYYLKGEVDNLISDFGGFEVVSSLPTQDIKKNIIYLLGPIGSGTDKYEEWIYSSNNWVKIGDTSVDLTNYLTTSAISDTNYGGAWNGDTTHAPSKNAIYTKLHTMDVEIGNKAADNNVVKLSGNQTVNGVKTFGDEPVLPSKTSDAINDGTKPATEAQVYKKQDKFYTIGSSAPVSPSEGDEWYDTTNDVLKTYDGSNWNEVGGGGGGDVSGPNSSTDGNIALFDGATGKLIKDGGKSLSDKQDTLTAGANIDITSNTIKADNVFIITDNDVTVTTTQEYGVSPYNTSYYYTNIEIKESTGITWREGAMYIFVCGTNRVASAYRNARVRIGTGGDWKPVMNSANSILGASSYLVKNNTRLFVYKSVHEVNGALHMNADTTYSTMSTAEIDAGTGTGARTITPVNLKYGVQKYAVDLVNAQTVGGVKTFTSEPVLPSKSSDAGNNATKPATEAQVYKKQDTLVSGTSIKTINNISLLGSGNVSVGDIKESGFTFNTASSGSSLSISNLSTKFTPNQNFTVSCSTVKEGMQYVLRITSGATAYTMSLGTGITNPFNEDLTLTASKITTVVFLATSSSALELFSIRTEE